MALFTYDSFDRANGAVGTSTSGHAWTVQSGTWAISGNQLLCTTTGGKPGITIDHSTPDGEYQIGLPAHSAVGDYSGLLLRYIDANNFVRVWIYNSGSSTYAMYIDKYVNGVYSNPIGPISITFVAGAVLKAVLKGSLLTATYNGLNQQTVLLENTTGTKHGLYADGDHTSDSVLLDNWSGGLMGIAVLDRFDRADSSTSLGSAESGQAWTAANGTWGISGGKAYTPSSVTSGTWGGLAVIDAGHNVMVVSAILDSNPANFIDYGITARYQDATNNWVAFLNRDSGGTLSVYAGKAVAGAVTYSICNGVVFPTMGGNANLKRYPASIALAVDANNIWRCYVNGVQVGNTVQDSAMSSATKAGLTSYGTTANKQDEFMVLTPSGVYVPPHTISGLQPYTREVLSTAPDAYWPMDDASGSTLVRDRAGAADLLVVGAPTLGDTDVLPGGRGASVSGWLNSKTLAHPVNTALSPGTGDFTVMFWGNFDPTQVSGKNWIMIPFCIDTYSFTGGGIQGDGLLVYLGVSGTLGAGVVMLVYVNSSSVSFTGLPTVIDSKTHCVIVERVSGVVTGYIDGTASTNTGALAGAAPSAQDRFLGMGGDPSGNTPGNNYYTQGRQAHTAFWKRGLTAAERTFLLNAGRQLGVVV